MNWFQESGLEIKNYSTFYILYYIKNKIIQKSQKKICNKISFEYSIWAFKKREKKWVISSAGRAAPF